MPTTAQASTSIPVWPEGVGGHGSPDGNIPARNKSTADDSEVRQSLKKKSYLFSTNGRLVILRRAKAIEMV